MACTIQVNAPQDVRNVVKMNGGYTISGPQCEFMRSRGLALRIVGSAAVFEGAALGWAHVNLMDDNAHIVSDHGKKVSILTLGERDQPYADKLLYEALAGAIKELDFALAAKEIEGYKSILKNSKQVSSQ